MSKCDKKQIADMILAYELGLLPDDERQKVELHILECSTCYQRVRQFQDMSQLMKNDTEARECIRQIAEDQTARTGARSATISKYRRKIPAYMRVALAVAAAVVLFLLTPWEIEFRPTHEAVATENRLAVMSFENLSDPGDSSGMGAIAANLLVTDLSQSQYVRVISSQRMQDILKKSGSADHEPAAEATVLAAAGRARAKWVLQGAIVQVQPSVIITTQLVEVADGSVFASHRVDGDPGEDIFAVIDRLTIEIKSVLTLPAKALQEEDRSIAEVTTSSIDAFKYYLEGVELSSCFYYPEATKAFHRALEFDSTFAMVYYHLIQLESRDYIVQALRYSEGASWREQHIIRATEATLAKDFERAIGELKSVVERHPDDSEVLNRLGILLFGLNRYRESIDNSKMVIAIDPENKTAFNQIAYAYNALGNLDSAIWGINRYIELAPDEANPYDSRGDLYAARGKLDEAIESFKAAIEIKPDYHVSLEKLGHMYMHKREYVLADSVYRLLESFEKPKIRSHARCCQAFGALRQGHRREALRLLDDGIARNRADQIVQKTEEMHRLKALIYEDMLQFEEALVELDTSIATYSRPTPNDSFDMLVQKVRVLAKMGNHDLAEQTVQELHLALQESGYSSAKYYSAAAIASWYRGDTATALSYAAKYNPTDDLGFAYPRRFMLGRLYLETDRLENAVSEFEDMLHALGCEPFYWGTFGARIHYYLGRAYEESRWYEKAIVQYETFLELWGNGDADITEIADARERLARLKDKS